MKNSSSLDSSTNSSSDDGEPVMTPEEAFSDFLSKMLASKIMGEIPNGLIGGDDSSSFECESDSKEEDIYSAIERASGRPGLSEQMSRMTADTDFMSFLSRVMEKEPSSKTMLPFPYPTGMDSSTLVPLRDDLFNEPFALGDSGVRADIFTTRPFMRVRILEKGILGQVGSSLFHYETMEAMALRKSDTVISVLDVYDCCGFEMAYSYLHRTYHSEMCVAYPKLLCIYLATSLAVIKPSYVEQIFLIMKDNPEALSLLLCSTLITELILLEQKGRSGLPLSSDLVPHQTELPVEILARIFNSTRISKSIASDVVQLRSNRELREGELTARARHTYIMHDPVMRTWSGLSGAGNKYLHVNSTEGKFSLDYCRTVGVVDEGTGRPVLYSYRDHARIRRAPERLMFQKAVAEVNTEDEDELCAWILLLSCERDSHKREVWTREMLLPTFLRVSEETLSLLS